LLSYPVFRGFIGLIPILGVILYYFIGMGVIGLFTGLAGIPWGITFNFIFIVFGFFNVVYSVIGLVILLVILAGR
jgi:hypothetical protein